MKYPEYKPIITLIPGGCPQFLDFHLEGNLLEREIRYFKEELLNSQEKGKYDQKLVCLMEENPEENPGVLIDMCEDKNTRGHHTSSPETKTEDYTVTLEEALDCFRGQWLPLPFLRITGQLWPDGLGRIERGPSNWARGMFLRDDENPLDWHLVILFDTKVEEKPRDTDGRYFALSQEDLNANAEFLLAWHVRDNSWFVNEEWIDQWLSDSYSVWSRSNSRYVDEFDTSRLKHLAHYMTWLDAAHRAIGSIRVRVADSNLSDAIDVDFVLDIGNSRTTGILIETSASERTQLNDSYLLELRDLTDLNKSSTEPFETRIEFADVSFGNDLLSRRSKRSTPAFAWPSCVRVGPEATRLATYAICAMGNTGMSSPKRYLWDESPWIQSWRYNTMGGQEPMVTRGLFPGQLNEYGTPLFAFDEKERRQFFRKSMLKEPKEPLFESHFTRSSLMMFMVGEIVTQALVNINSPATRANHTLSDKPRHLRRIIVTVPTAMPVAERICFKQRVELAVRLIWQCLSWNAKEQGFHYQEIPEVQCEWDEASCSQLVLLYNEIKIKHGSADTYFKLYGRKRKDANGRENPSVRIASIDIGGGTTDLSISTHMLTSGTSAATARIEPHMDFRDGFNIAGDEVLRMVIRNIVVPALQDALRKEGVNIQKATHYLFERYTLAKTASMRTRQGQFVRQVAVPVAIGLLETCEKLDKDDTKFYNVSFKDFFNVPHSSENTLSAPTKGAPLPQRGVLTFFDLVMKDCGAENEINLMETPLQFSLRDINECIRSVLQDTLASLCEIVHIYDADILLVTGRPSAWKGVMQTILAKAPIAPDRIIPMRSYHVGNWYPCSDIYGCISDPKSTVVVGAILCALSCGYLDGINFDASHMRMTSTARYIGELNIDGQLENSCIWFAADKEPKEQEEKEIIYHSPITVGYRQLAVERWPASRYYRLDFSDKSQPQSGSFAVRIKLTRKNSQMMSHDTRELPASEGTIEVIGVSKLLPDGKRQQMHPATITASLQTLPNMEGYWLDTGIIND